MDPDKSSCFSDATRALAEKTLLSFKQGDLILADNDFLAFEVAKKDSLDEGNNPTEDTDWYAIQADQAWSGFETISILKGDILVFLKKTNVLFKKNRAEIFGELSKGCYSLFWHLEKQTTFIYRSDCLDEVFKRLV